MVIVVWTSACYSATSVKLEQFGFGTTCPPDSSDEWPHFHVHLLLTWWFVTVRTMCGKSVLNRKPQVKLVVQESDLCLLSIDLFFKFFHSHIKLHISSIAPKIKALLLLFLHYHPFFQLLLSGLLHVFKYWKNIIAILSHWKCKMLKYYKTAKNLPSVHTAPEKKFRFVPSLSVLHVSDQSGPAATPPPSHRKSSNIYIFNPIKNVKRKDQSALRHC